MKTFYAHTHTFTHTHTHTHTHSHTNKQTLIATVEIAFEFVIANVVAMRGRYSTWTHYIPCMP